VKRILTAILILISAHAMAQTAKYTVAKDTETDQVIFNGPITFDDLSNEPTFTWLKAGADRYEPDAKAINTLQEKLPAYTFVVFMGTWCDDSHNIIPKLYKVLKVTEYPIQQGITMYGTDREKHTQGGEDKKYNITLVPTIIVLKKGEEVGRITESVQKSLEEDLVNIISVGELQK